MVGAPGPARRTSSPKQAELRRVDGYGRSHFGPTWLALQPRSRAAYWLERPGRYGGGFRSARSWPAAVLGSPACNDCPMPAPSTGPRSPAEDGVYGQHDFSVRFDWGPDGADAVAPGVDVVVVIDVLSFTTAVSVATARGALIFPYPWEDGAAEFAASKRANLAGARADGGFSLSPVSFTSVQRNDRVVLRSPNGATICWRLTATGVRVVAGCLRNASAVGRFLAGRVGRLRSSPEVSGGEARR